MEFRTVAMSGVVAALLVFAGACASEPPEDAPNSAEPSVEETESSPTATKSSVQEPTDDPSKKADAPSEETARVKIIDTDFRPVELTVGVGATVKWKQVGDQPHSVTAADGSFDSSPECGPLDSDKCLGEGDRFTHTFDEAGEFTYYCRVHGLPDGTGMVGTVVVR